MGLDAFLSNVRCIVGADSTHSGPGMLQEEYFGFGIQGCLWLLECFLLAFAISGAWFLISRKAFINKMVTAFSAVVFLSHTARIFLYRERFTQITVYVLVILFGALCVKCCSGTEKRIYYTGLLLSIGSFFATLLLTNLDILSVVSYLILAVMVSFIPIGKWLMRNMDGNHILYKQGAIILFCMMILFHRGLIVKTMNSLASNILDLGGIIKAGPAMGIVTDYMGAYETKCNMEDWSRYTQPGDRLLAVADNVLNPMIYLYQDITISAPSVISTPTYDDFLLDYWEENPEREPNVIVVRCWYGDLLVEEDNWVLKWMEHNGERYESVDGRYWRFYRRLEE